MSADGMLPASILVTFYYQSSVAQQFFTRPDETTLVDVYAAAASFWDLEMSEIMLVMKEEDGRRVLVPYDHRKLGDMPNIGEAALVFVYGSQGEYYLCEVDAFGNDIGHELELEEDDEEEERGL